MCDEADPLPRLTVDACVINWLFQFKLHHHLPRNCNVNRMPDFAERMEREVVLAVNDFIRTEYHQAVGLELVKNWLKERFKNELAAEVERRAFEQPVRRALRDEYGFTHGDDRKYLETAFNTSSKHFVTENRKHFQNLSSNRTQRSLVSYLKTTLDLLVATIDECCCLLEQQPGAGDG